MADRTGEAHGWGGSVETAIRIPGADGSIGEGMA